MNHVTATQTDRGTGPEDQMLIQAALRGDREAVDQVMQRLGCVVRFVYRLNKSMGYGLPTEALEDVSQQVFVALWPRMQDYAGTAALETWVYGFCRNCLRAEHRRRAVRLRVVHDEEAFHELEAPAPQPEDRASQMESLDLLHEELDRLDPLDREIVELRHFQDRSFEQIARHKSLPASTIKDRCYRAVDKIRGRLKRRYGRA